MDVRNFIPNVFTGVFIHSTWDLVLSWLHWHKWVQSVKKTLQKMAGAPKLWRLAPRLWCPQIFLNVNTRRVIFMVCFKIVQIRREQSCLVGLCHWFLFNIAEIIHFGVRVLVVNITKGTTDPREKKGEKYRTTLTNLCSNFDKSM